MINQKGLSNTVNVVLFVLFGLVAISVLWFFISGFLKDSTDDTPDFSDVGIRVISVGSDVIGGQTVLCAKIQRAPGSPSSVSKLAFKAYTDDNILTFDKDIDYVLNEYSEEVYNLNIGSAVAESINKIEVYAIINGTMSQIPSQLYVQKITDSCSDVGETIDINSFNTGGGAGSTIYNPTSLIPTSGDSDSTSVICTDSDGGKVYSVAGVTKLSTGVSKADYCNNVYQQPLNGYWGLLTEYYCSDGLISSESKTCISTCSDDMKSCTDVRY
jgi:hypothetical protein